MKRALAFLIVTAGIPLLGILGFSYVISAWNAENVAAGVPTYEALCSISDAELEARGLDADLRGAIKSDCSTHQTLSLLLKVSWFALVAALSLPMLFLASSWLIGGNRTLLATVFPVILRVSLVVLAASAVVQGVLFAALVYFLESHFIGRVHVAIVGLAALGGVATAFAVVSQALSIARNKPFFVVGSRLSANDLTGLRILVEDVARKVGAKVPDNVVVGLEPNFFATSAPVQLAGESAPLKGDTVYLSAPLARLFSRDEFAAVIGHELGHFIGLDTKYSMKFAPMYRQLQTSVSQITQLDGALSIAAVPAEATLNLMLSVFANNERRIGRDRELEADSIGAKAGSAEAVISALVKVALVGPVYGEVQRYNIDKLAEGELLANLSRLMQFVSRESVLSKSAGDVLSIVGTSVASHPIDSHPTLAARASSLGVDLSKASESALLDLQAQHQEEFVDDPLAELEKEITLLEQRVAVASGQVVLPASESASSSN